MSTHDEVVEYANYYRDTPSLCVVEVADETFVVTNTAAQAEVLRATLGGLRDAIRVYATTAKAEPIPPVKRAPRKAV